MPVRQLILSGDNRLVWRCFEPRLHPMLTPPMTAPGDELTQWWGGQSITVGTEGSPETEEFPYSTEHTTETVVNPLYGLRRTGDREYTLNELVDWSVPPIRYGPWLNTKSLQIDSTILTAEELLNMMVNREGAHSELNEWGADKRRGAHRHQRRRRQG